MNFMKKAIIPTLAGIGIVAVVLIALHSHSFSFLNYTR